MTFEDCPLCHHMCRCTQMSYQSTPLAPNVPGHAPTVIAAGAVTVTAPTSRTNPAPFFPLIKPDPHIMPAQATAVAVTVTAPTSRANPAPFTSMPIADLFDLAVSFRYLRCNRLKWFQRNLGCLCRIIAASQCSETKSSQRECGFYVDHALSFWGSTSA